MRVAILLCVGAVPPATGCTYAVVTSGKNLSEVKTAEQARAEFGPPVGSGVADGKPFEEFRTHRKIAEPNKVIYLMMGYAVTFGTGELIWFPQQSFIAARRWVCGQTLRFVYDEHGKVTTVVHDGEPVIYPPKDAEPASTADENTPNSGMTPQTPPVPVPFPHP